MAVDKPDVGDPPVIRESPENLNLTREQLLILGPYFRNALWYHEAYNVYVQYSISLEQLNKSQGEDITELLVRVEYLETHNDGLMATIIIMTAASLAIIITVKVLL